MLCADNMNKTSRATTIISLDFRTFFPIISSSQSASTRFSISNPVGWDHHSPNEANRAQFHIYKHDSMQTTNHAIIKKNKMTLFVKFITYISIFADENII